MLYTHKELLNEYKSNYLVKKAVKEQKFLKLERVFILIRKMFTI